MKRIISTVLMSTLLLSVFITTVLFYSNVYNRNLEFEQNNISILGEDISTLLLGDRDSSLLSLKKLDKNPNLNYFYISETNEILLNTHKTLDLNLSESFIKELTNESQKFNVLHSKNMGENYLFYSKKLSNDDYIVVYKLTENTFNVLADSFPGLIGFIGIGFFVILSISKKIVDSFVSKIEDQTRDININDIEINNKYVELYPFVRIIKEQKDWINRQILELENQSNTINTIISNMQEGVILLDNEFNILLLNSSVLDLLNIKADFNSYIDRNVFGLIRDEKFIQELNSVNKNVTNRTFSEIKISDKYINLSISSVYKEYDVIGYVLLLKDETKQKLIDLQRMEFSANVSHELKTPLTSINGYAEMLKNGLVPINDVSRFGSIIFDEGSKLLMLIDDIIKLSKLDEGKSETEVKIYNLSNIIDEVINSLEVKAKSYKVKLNYDNKGDFPFMCNEQLLRELFLNLIDNGIKYNKTDGEVCVEISKDSNNYFIEVSDTGIGITENEVNRIFERFYTVDKSHNKKDSSGLGLAIVKHIVRLYRGVISVDSMLNEGTTFTIRLPIN